MKKAVKYEIMKTIRNRIRSICSSAGRPSMVRDGPLPSRRCGVLCSHCMAATPHPLHPSQLSLLHECLIWLLTYAVRVLLTLPSAASTPHKAGCRHANAGYYCHCVLPAPRPPATASPLQWTPPAGDRDRLDFCQGGAAGIAGPLGLVSPVFQTAQPTVFISLFDFLHVFVCHYFPRH